MQVSFVERWQNPDGTWICGAQALIMGADGRPKANRQDDVSRRPKRQLNDAVLLYPPGQAASKKNLAENFQSIPWPTIFFFYGAPRGLMRVSSRKFRASLTTLAISSGEVGIGIWTVF